MDTETVEETSKQAAGKVQEEFGAAVGDAASQISGKTRELSGKAQQLCADTANLVRERMAESPFAVLAIFAAVGFIAGMVWANSGRPPSPTYPKNSGANDRAY